jgi:hypothetical protein
MYISLKFARAWYNYYQQRPRIMFSSADEIVHNARKGGAANSACTAVVTPRNLLASPVTAAVRRTRATTPSGAPPTGATGSSSKPTARSSVELTVYTLPAKGPGSAAKQAASSAGAACHDRNVRRSLPPLTSRCSHGSISISRSPTSYRVRVPGTVPLVVCSLTTRLWRGQARARARARAIE